MAPSNTDRTGFVPTSATSLLSYSKVITSARTPLPTAGLTAPCPAALRIPTLSTPGLATQLFPQRIAQPPHNPPSSGGHGGVSIVLFRSDLRLDDHPALTRALEQSSTIVPVFCFDPRHFGRTEHGFDKTGRDRARFLIEGVHNLRESLRALGADLIVRHGRPETAVPEIAAMTAATHVFLHREVTYEEQETERALRKALRERSIDMDVLWANTLYEQRDLPFELGEMPDVYSDFREAAEKGAEIRDPTPAPEELAALPAHLEPGSIPSLADLGIVGVADSRGVSGVSAVKGGEDEALQRVRSYVRDARKLDARPTEEGNEAAHLGADFSCRISPWLALGCVSPKRIFKMMRDASVAPGALLRTSTYLELVWRDFFRYITAKYSERRAAAGGKRVSNNRRALATTAL